MQMRAPLSARNCSQPVGRLQDQIVLVIQPGGKASADRQFQIVTGMDRKLVALVEKGKDRFDPVIAVRQPLPDVESEIDFGTGGFAVRRAPEGSRHQGETSSGRRPRSILLARRCASSPSANNLADFHA